MPDDSVMRLVYLALLFAALAGWAVVELRKGLGRSFKMVAAWALIFLGVMAVYGLWGDITRGMKPSQQVGAGAVTLPRADDGHYYAQLSIGGKEVTFMVDTGASDLVLTPQDAQRVGIDPATLMYMGQASTANGIVRTAHLALQDVAFGPFHDASVAA
ncbi:MAG: aspartyl protease, partial [Rhodobacterales bacterium 17-64-5]